MYGYEEYYGWPVKSSVKYVDVQALDGKSFLPKRQYECLDGCGRGSLDTNTLILVAATLGPYGLLKLWPDTSSTKNSTHIDKGQEAVDQAEAIAYGMGYEW